MSSILKKARVLLIIPCYDEEHTIMPLLDEITRCGLECSTIVIDDGSSDASYNVAKTRSPTIRLIRNLGIGGAVQTGIKYAERNGFDFCVQVDGDGQHPPGEVIKLLNAYKNFPYSIIIGSRYILNDSFRSTWARRIGGQTIALALNFLFPACQVTDPTSGMRLMDRKAIKFFSKHYPHDFPEPISLAWALKEGLSVAEIPVKMREREHGDSTIIGLKPAAYMLRVLGYILLARIMKSSERKAD